MVISGEVREEMVKPASLTNCIVIGSDATTLGSTEPTHCGAHLDKSLGKDN